MFAGIELGGTSVKVAVANTNDLTTLVRQTRIPTTTPEETMGKVIEWLDGETFTAIGVACFGPLDVRPNSTTYGYITTTPKPGWQQFDVLAPLRKYGVPLGFDTDVNAAALGEQTWGGHGNAANVAYITVGTGVGVGVVVDGKAVHGLLHPEGGHIGCPRSDAESLAHGVCPYHTECVEGYVRADAIAARVGLPPSELATVPDSDGVWGVVGFYLGHLCATITLLCSPEVIVVGGGVVVNRPVIVDEIRRVLPKVLNGYLQSDKLEPDNIASFVVTSMHGDNAGVVGAMELARRATS